MHFFFFFISLCFYFKFFGKDATNDANMSKTYFWVFLLFFAIFGFLKKNFIKNWITIYASLFTMLTKQNLINDLHNELVKKKKCLPGLLSDPLF
jgi:hypothetical protein